MGTTMNTGATRKSATRTATASATSSRRGPRRPPPMPSPKNRLRQRSRRSNAERSHVRSRAFAPRRIRGLAPEPVEAGDPGVQPDDDRGGRQQHDGERGGEAPREELVDLL